MSEGMQSLEFENPALAFYSPFTFVRKLSDLEQAEKFVLPKLKKLAVSSDTCFECRSGDVIFRFFFEFLKWDTDYFSLPTFKLFFVEGATVGREAWRDAVTHFSEHLERLAGGRFYCFMEIPTEDTRVLQGLTGSGFALIETRLNYFHDQVQDFTGERFPVRDAVLGDTELLREVAMKARNSFDRFHADPVFGIEKADGFLATYVENSIRGFSDITLVPAADGMRSAGFLTGNYQRDVWTSVGTPIAKMVLSAVSPECRGWYRKLVSELTFRFKQEGVACVHMNTQSSNRAVVKVWESLGYRYGNTVHVLSF